MTIAAIEEAARALYALHFYFGSFDDTTPAIRAQLLLYAHTVAAVLEGPARVNVMPTSAFDRQREAWLAEHPDWDRSVERPWPPPMDVPSPLHMPDEEG